MHEIFVLGDVGEETLRKEFPIFIINLKGNEVGDALGVTNIHTKAEEISTCLYNLGETE